MDDTQEKPKQEIARKDAESNAEKPEGEKPEIKEVGEAVGREDLQKAKALVETMQIDDDAKAQTATAAQSLAGVKEQEKINQLLELAKKRGVIFAVKTAQKMNDPYVLDSLHDLLAKQGYYKEFLK